MYSSSRSSYSYASPRSVPSTDYTIHPHHNEDKQQMAALMTATALATISPALADGPAHMTPETMLTLARVGSGALSPDGKLVVYSVGFPNIQDNKIRTEFFTISAQGTNRTQITKAIPRP